jgi:acetyl-CoA C-acetyltransferase
VDQFGLESHRRAVAARDAGKFDRSVVPVTDESGLAILARDEMPRADTSLEKLAQLKPAFEMLGAQFGLDALVRRKYPQIDKVNHVHTAGNSSGIVDGASAVLIGSKEKGQALGLKARARIRTGVSTGEEPVVMLTGPLSATHAALKKARMKLADIDLFEVNEAFAAVPLLYMKELGVPHDQLNVNGGAIALGHPLGATGAMLLGTALDLLEERNLSTALMTLCIAGGMGTATIIERV